MTNAWRDVFVESRWLANRVGVDLEARFAQPIADVVDVVQVGDELQARRVGVLLHHRLRIQLP